MAISWDLLIFNGWYLQFLVGSMHTFKIVKNQKLILGYWEIALIQHGDKILSLVLYLHEFSKLKRA